MLLPVLRQIEQKALVERSARSLRRATRVSVLKRCPGFWPGAGRQTYRASGAAPSTAAGRARAADQPQPEAVELLELPGHLAPLRCHVAIQQPDLGIERRLGLRLTLLRAGAELFSRVHHTGPTRRTRPRLPGVEPPPISVSIGAAEPPALGHSAGPPSRLSRVGDRTDSYSRL